MVHVLQTWECETEHIWPKWNRKQLGSSSESYPLPQLQVWCLLRLAYLKCSFCLEPKFSELISCLTKNSNISSQIWKPKCSHLSWKIQVPDERLPLKQKISDKRKACTIYLFRQVMPLGWRQSFARGRAINISLEGWAAQPCRFALRLLLSQAAAQLSTCRTLSRCWSTLLNSGLRKAELVNAEITWVLFCWNFSHVMYYDKGDKA